MPAFYAHDRFGRKVYSRLDGEIKQTIKKHSRQFKSTAGSSGSGCRDRISFSFTGPGIQIRSPNMEIISMRYLPIPFSDTGRL